MRTVCFAPGAIAAGANIDVPAGSPAIDGVINAEIFRGSDATAAAAEVAVTATKVDINTVTLDAASETLDLLTLRYQAIGEMVRP